MLNPFSYTKTKQTFPQASRTYWSVEPILVYRVKQSLKGNVGGAPRRVVEVVAGAVQGAILAVEAAV